MINIDIDELIKSINNGLTISELSKLFNVSVSTIKRKMSENNLKSLSRDLKKKYYICKECNIEFISKDKDRKFCTNKCSLNNNQKILSDNRQFINDKISKKLRIKIVICCKECNNEFIKKRKKQIFCNRQCSSKNISKRAEIKLFKSLLFTRLTKERHENGDTSIGWQIRNILTPSYPEKLTIDILNKKKLEYEYEKKVGKFFIDFAFNKYMIALEIDGRTHDDIYVKEKDMRKDKFLNENGWRVFRIKWKNPKEHYRNVNDFIDQVFLFENL